MRLSIIIPVYNVEAYVGRTLDTVFETSAPNDDFEVIVVNDGSQDGSMAVVRRFAEHSNMTVLEQENQGLSAARMKGLSFAKGDYVWFVDSDDWLVKDGVMEVLKSLNERPEAEVLFFPTLSIGIESSSEELDCLITKELLVRGGKEMFDTFLPMEGSFRYVIRRDLFRNEWLFFPIGLLMEDIYFGPVLMYLANSIRVIPKVVYLYRKNRPGSIMDSLTIRASYDIVAIHKLLMRFMRHEVKKEDKEWFRHHCFSKLTRSYSLNKRLWGSPDFNRFVRTNGLYVWRQWKKVFPKSPSRKLFGRFFFYMMPKTHYIMLH